MVLVFSLFVVLIFLGSLFDIGEVVPQRIAVQNAADAAAKACALWQTRGLNLIGNCNVVQFIMMLNYVMPFQFAFLTEEDVPLEMIQEMAGELQETQELVARSFPLMGLLSASIMAEANGAAAVDAKRLAELGLEAEGMAVDQALSSDPIFSGLDISLHAFPLGRHRYIRPDSLALNDLGVEPLEPEEVKDAFGTILDVNPSKFVSPLIESYPRDPATVVEGLSILFFGFLSEGGIEHVYTIWTEEEAVRIDTDGGPRNVLSLHGMEKLWEYLIVNFDQGEARKRYNQLRERVRIDGRNWWVIPVIGPLTWDDFYNNITSAFDDFVDWITESIYLAWRIARDDQNNFIFNFYGPDRDFWTKTIEGGTYPDYPRSVFVTWGPEGGIDSFKNLFKTKYSRVFGIAQASPVFMYRLEENSFNSENEDGNLVYDAMKSPIVIPQFRRSTLEKVVLPDSCSLSSKVILH